MKKILTSLLLFFSLNATFAQSFQVVGYLPYYRFSLVNEIDFEKLTHLNIAFANPDMDGILDVGGQDIGPIVDMGHDAGLTVSISLAGGALTPEWAAAWEHLIKPGNRSAFIHKIMEYMQVHDLDGADVDLEWSHVNSDYSGFVLELKDSLVVFDKIMTAALPGTTRYTDITDEALAAFDNIHMMVYDLTGPWAPNNPGPHSPYAFAQISIAYWENQGVPAEKLTLGVPFYGYDFSDQNNVTSFTFQSMVAQDPGNAYLDQVGQAYYNGIPTIEDKTLLALEEVGGVMIWELGQDALTEYPELSLLNVIDYTLEGIVATTDLENPQEVLIYPNPVNHSINIVAGPESEDVQVYIWGMDGRLVFSQAYFLFDQSIRIDVSGLSSGFYFLQLLSANEDFKTKLIKR